MSASRVLSDFVDNGDGALEPLVPLDKDGLWKAAWHCSSYISTMEPRTKLVSSSQPWMEDHIYSGRLVVDSIGNDRDILD